jgi:E3 ubiquitin-protein ligase synoviolin
VLVILLLLCDVYPIFFSVKEFMDKGPGVHILFGFECSLLLVSSVSNIALHWMHIIDGLVTVLQHLCLEKENNTGVLEDKNEHEIPLSAKKSIYNYLSQMLIASWLENRATLTFAVELTADAAKFLFYLLFFFAVYSFYGVPLNIVREIYSSFVKLRQRLLAFSSYHRLTRSMNKHFSTITTEEELDTAGRTCIICRDRMEVTGTNGGCKELPACQHVFHKHCLRQWLVQQQTCPTCRREILSRKSDSRKSTNQEQVEMNDEETLTPILNEDEKRENNSSKLTSENLSGHLREKISSREIISTGIKETKSSLIVPENINQDKHRDMFNLQFPCIFRVIAQDGANVIGVNELNNTSKTQWKKIRTIPLGKLVVVTELRCVPKRSETISGGKEQVVILHKIPDGWVFGTDLHIVLMLGVN